MLDNLISFLADTNWWLLGTYLFYWVLLVGTGVWVLWMLFGKDEYTRLKRDWDLEEQIEMDREHQSRAGAALPHANNNVDPRPSPYLMQPKRSIEEVNASRFK